MIKELFKDNYKRYFEGEKLGKKIIFSVNEWDQEYTKPIKEIEKAFNEADLPQWVREEIETLEQKLNRDSLSNLFSLNMYSFRNELESNNYNLYEYEKFIQGVVEPPKALKSACICRDRNSDYYYIACEPYDSESALTRDNVKIIESHISMLYREIEKLLNMNYSHTERY